MKRTLNIAFFGSSLVSAYWNGAATYYRGIIRELHARGHRVTFYEPDAYQRQAHRDIPDPEWAQVVVYSATDQSGPLRALESARGADVIVKASGVGVFDELLEEAVPALARASTYAIFWDVDAPATLARMRNNPHDPLRTQIPLYDAVFTYGGGPRVVAAYRGFGAQRCELIYNALDPQTHYPVPADPRFQAGLGFLGNRLPDREMRVEQFFLDAATRLGGMEFVLGGSGWQDKPLPPNVRYMGHVYTRDHNAFNCSTMAVLNVNRDSMASNGYSPPTRVFEAAGAAACLISDAWEGLETFLEPEREVLVAASGADVAHHLAGLTPERAREIGQAARRRVLAEHTYAHRAIELETILLGASVARKVAS